MKSGYILSNCVGILDPAYHGTILVGLTKIDDKAEDIKLPFRCCQLIFHQQNHVEISEVLETELDETSRGEGGLGSTG
jgi:dUTP pyrophosphatase